MIADYQYINTSNPFHVVRLTLDGDFVEVGFNDGEECDAQTIKAMANMDDVDGFTLDPL
ncbi:hypothetical protein ValSw41_17 [Vibrio phage ValSw4_1]|nr:hypothetical protein ValSw41_17 [Vibrio phage ValSw4_1]QQO38283.1 hypothetical protein [Vibrio phage vB_VpaS_VP-RY-9]WGH28485.1 hypothetical protein 13VO501A_gene0102 [Vibrio phage 13VO501A]CAH0448223.1 hypothetical protein SM030_00090 [Vibrio phage vB_VpaS_sm030]CAI5930302.1 hypothetical protein SM031_00090 [Vibrio phage vB_VpaS_sm030]